MLHSNCPFLTSAISTTLILAAVSIVTSAASAQRSVPVVVGNDASAPIPVSLVQSGQPGGREIRYVLCVDNVAGPGVDGDYPGCLEIRSLGFGVGRAMKESGEKGGTADVNIGVGELAPVMIEKNVDGSSALLWTFGINGNLVGSAEIYVLEERAGWSKALPTLELRLDRTFVQSMSVDPGSFLEQVGLYFNKIQLKTYSRDTNGSVILESERCWDAVLNVSGCTL